MSGGSTVGSSLTGDQKGLISEITRQIRGEPSKTPNSPLAQGAPQYQGPLLGKLPKGMDDLAAVSHQISPTMNLQASMNALQPSLQGQSAYNFKNLTPGSPLSMPTYGATGALAPQQSGYNYNPQQVSSNYNYQPGQVKSDLDNANFTQNYFNSAVKAPLLNTYNTDIAPKISDAAASAGSTFSTRTTVAKQKALSDLQTQMAAQLSTAARQDNIEKSQQDLAAQQFNVNAGMQNAQFGSGQNLQAQQLNQAAGLNNAQFGAGQNLAYAGLNSQNQLALDAQNSSNMLNSANINNQQRLQYDTLNTNANINLGENARANQMQSAMLAQEVGAQPYNNALAGQQLLAPLQNYNNANAQAQYSQWSNAQAYNNPWLKLAMGVSGLNPQSYVQQNPTAFQTAGQALGLGAAGMSLASAAGIGGGGAALALPSAFGAAGAAGMTGAEMGLAGTAGAAGAAAGGADIFSMLAPLLLAF
jgi:hypothetical protein